ncbi:type VI secretion system tip protein TssI/VgrG [Pseudomonas sp. PSKL.D1]|uniref:type VI secretion system tip protein TssI/VgrG n=1 Tax=Pseudomonas sp. PSKL.D1 TaxID=3029060 RepID=UPI0023811E64|nr:type VI secretion system tip protein TssI/VgrG [Pseudomonas sp. PSKL.D1]WDY55722.1 type VI secretion system tip protein TssI/VgrG [Pseudomonas sp. PSKL.D1]
MIMDLVEQLTAQHRRLFKFNHSDLAETQLLLDSFKGTDSLSQPFEYQLQLLCNTPQIPLKSMLGQQASLEIELADAVPRFINGYLTAFASLGSDGAVDRYSATFSPWLTLLRHRVDTRIFQNCTVEEVVREVFASYPGYAQYEFRLYREQKRHSYLTQYRETDFNFVQRLLEQAGLFYLFEHSATAHTLVISDYPPFFDPLPEQPNIRFHSNAITETADAITRWSASRQVQAGSMAIQTFDYRQPGNRMPVAMRSVIEQGDVQRLEVYDPGQYTHGTNDEGEDVLRTRIEALELRAKVFEGASNCRAMRPGYSFELQQHPGHDQAPLEDREFLLMSVHSEGHNNHLSGQHASYANTFTCVRKKIPFRPQATTPRPTINGPQTAIVVGPPGEEIFTDELGRVKVQFHWDRLGGFNEGSSCWVRVAQTGASGGFGSIQLPRVDDEVVVLFLDGNPDRPLIIGSVYNSRNTPPWSLPANKTQSGVLTRSIKGTGRTANFLRFEDKAGAEQVSLHAERNMDTEVEADDLLTVGGNRTIKVAGRHAQTIRLETSIAVEEGSYFVTVDQGHLNLKAAQTLTLEVGKSKLVMNQDGTITLSGVVVDVDGSTIINLNKSN